MTPFLSLISLVTISLFLSPFSITSAIVLDINGNTVRNGGTYYMIAKGRGGGLTIGQNAWEPPCPSYITRRRSAKDGLPTTVSALVRTLFVPTSSPVYFSFNTDRSPCPTPQQWNVTTSTTGRLYIVCGGSSGFPVRFTIEEAAGTKKFAYKIRYCLSSEEDKKCGYVGFFRSNGLMGITNENALVVSFKEVDDVKGLSQM